MSWAARAGVPAQRPDHHHRLGGCHRHGLGEGAIVADWAECHCRQNRMGAIVTDRVSALSPKMVVRHPQRHIVLVVPTQDRTRLAVIPQRHIVLITPTRDRTQPGIISEDTWCSSPQRETAHTECHPTMKHSTCTRPYTAGHHLRRHIVQQRRRVSQSASGITHRRETTDADEKHLVRYYTHIRNNRRRPRVWRPLLDIGVEYRTQTGYSASSIAHGHETTDADWMCSARYYTRRSKTGHGCHTLRRSLHTRVEQRTQTGYSASGITRDDQEPVAVGIHYGRFYAQVWNTGHENRHPRQVLHNPVKHPPRFTPPADGRRPPVRAGSRRTPCR